MELAEYVTTLMRGRTYYHLKKDKTLGFSASALHQIAAGLTPEPKPKTLEAMARFFAEGDDAKAREYYTRMMELAGYLEMLDEDRRRRVARLKASLPESEEAVRAHETAESSEVPAGDEAEQSAN